MRKANRIGRWIMWSFAAGLVGLAVANAVAGNVLASLACSTVASLVVIEA